MLPKNLSEFFQYAVHLVYAIVIGLSFEIAGKVVIPIEKIDTYFDLINVGILFLAYFIVVTSWIGYFKSISDKKHKENKKGIARFGLDLFIVFIFYYLVILTDPINSGYYQDIFIFIIPSLYGVYAVWDTIKYYEYKSSLRTVKEKKNNKRRRKITFNYLVVFSILGFIYSILFYFKIDYPTQNEVPIRDFLYIGLYIVLTGLYRHAKWLVVDVKKRKKKPKSSKKS